MRARGWIALVLLWAALFACAWGEELPAWYGAAQQGETEALIRRHEKLRVQPCIAITTLEGQAILSRDSYVPAVIEVFNAGEEYRLTAAGGVKVRGNSSAGGDEKPYRIKFDRKQNLLGLHGGMKYRSWVLLRSSWNLAPDYLALNLARTILGDSYYVSDCLYVNVIVNGEWKGLYVLCEQNQIARGRFDLHEPSPEETGTDIGYLLELDNYPSEEHPYFAIDLQASATDINGVTRPLVRRHYSVKTDLTDPAQLAFIGRHLEGVFRILYEASVNGKAMMLDEDGRVVSGEGVYATPYEAVCAVVDMESLANMVILEELVHNYDVGEGSFFMAVDFSPESRCPRLTFAGPWDFNWGYEGPADGGYYAVTFQPYAENADRSNGWMILAMGMEEFRELVRVKWTALSESGALEETVERVRLDCARLPGDLGKDQWRLNSARNLMEFVLGRIRWLNGRWR